MRTCASPRLLAAMLVSMPQEGQRGRKVGAAQLLDAAGAELSFDDLVAHQREDAAFEKERPRIAVPVDARCAAAVVVATRTRVEGAELGQLQLLVREKEYRCRFAVKLPGGGFAGTDDRQAEQSVSGIVEKPVATSFALASVRAHVAPGGGGYPPEAQAGEVQVAPVA